MVHFPPQVVRLRVVCSGSYSYIHKHTPAYFILLVHCFNHKSVTIPFRDLENKITSKMTIQFSKSHTGGHNAVDLVLNKNFKSLRERERERFLNSWNCKRSEICFLYFIFPLICVLVNVLRRKCYNKPEDDSPRVPVHLHGQVTLPRYFQRITSTRLKLLTSWSESRTFNQSLSSTVVMVNHKFSFPH